MTVARLLACAVDEVPCQPANQQWVTLAESIDFVGLGVTSADILYVFSWGAGAVLLLWSLGFAVGAASRALGKA